MDNIESQLENYFLAQKDEDLSRFHYETELRALERTRRGLASKSTSDNLQIAFAKY